MRIVSYNILNGGEGRADPLAEVLIAQRADVICLVECSHPAVLDRIATRLGMDVAVATAGRDPVAVLSRFPVLQTIDHAAINANFTGASFETVVQLPSGCPLPINVVHLAANATEAAEQQREMEMRTVLGAMAIHRAAGRPHVIAGDFNSNSPTQKIDLARCKPATRALVAANGGILPRRAIQLIADAGYHDSLRTIHGERADEMCSFTTRWPGQRVDYIFSFRMNATGAWIEQDRLAKYASDHHPIGVEFDSLESTA